MKEIKSVAFFGCSCSDSSHNAHTLAFETAKLVARSGRRVVNGGGPGVMLASTEGAKDGGGKVTVVYYKPLRATKFEGEATKNLADEHFTESNYVLRTKKLLELADIYVIFNGGTGTISEFGMAWGVARIYFGHHKPLILVGGFWREIIAAIKANMRMRPEENEVIKIVDSPKEALEAIESYEEVLRHNRHDHKGCASNECQFLL